MGKHAAEYALVMIIGVLLVYLFVLTPVQETANSLKDSANFITEITNG